MKRPTPHQITSIDGSIYAYEVAPGRDLVYVTIAGYGPDPLVIPFDSDDLDALNRARKELKQAVGK